MAAPARAALYSWDTTKSGGWNDGTDWVGGVAPQGADATDVLQFGGAVAYSANVAGPDPFVLNQIVLQSAAGGPTIGTAGPTVQFSGAGPQLLQNGAGAFNFNAPASLSVGTTFGGTGAGRVFVGGAIGGGGLLTFSAGTWQFGNAASSWAGGTTINAGAVVELLPAGAAPQNITLNNAATSSLLGANNTTLTINGGTLKFSPTGTGSITLGKALTFGSAGGTVTLVNDDPTVTGAVNAGNIAAGDFGVTTTAGASAPVVFQFNGGHLHQSNTVVATQYDWNSGINSLRFNAVVNNGPVRVELLNGALHRLGNGGGGTQVIAAPYIVRGTFGGDPGSGDLGTVNVGNQRFGGTGRLLVDNANVVQLDGGLFLEDAVQVAVAGAARALNANVTVRGTASGHPANVSFSGRATGTAIAPGTLNAPGATGTGHNVLYLGSDGSATPALNAKTLSVEGGGVANLDLRVRGDQGNHSGVVVDALTAIQPGGTVRLKQSLSNSTPAGTDPVSGAANVAITAGNVGNIIWRGNIQGQGTSAADSVLEVLLPTAQNLAAPGPLGGADFQATTALVVNGTGTGGLRVVGTARPNALLGAGPDPVTTDVKVGNLLTATRLAGLTGSGGYLTVAPAAATFAVPAGSDWSAGVTVGLKVVDSNAGGADVSLPAGTFVHNVLVDAGASLSAAGVTVGPASATTGLGRLSGTGSIAGPLTLNAGGTVAPGLGTVTPGVGTGTLTVTGGLSVLGTYAAEVTGPAAGQADVLAVAGGLTLGAASVLNLTGATLNGTSTYTIATYDARTGTFGSVVGLPGSYTLNYGTGTNSAITLAPVPVPEPATAGAVLAVGGLLLGRRRRHRAGRNGA